MPNDEANLRDALDAVTLARKNAERNAGYLDADPEFNKIAGLCCVAQIELRKALKLDVEPSVLGAPVDSLAARAL